MAGIEAAVNPIARKVRKTCKIPSFLCFNGVGDSVFDGDGKGDGGEVMVTYR